MDSNSRMRGICIYHVLQCKDKTILHVRQAAMIEKNKGYTSVIARYLADQYPNAIYEANQRQSNYVAMKQILLDENLLSVIAPVLGYSDKYIGLCSHLKLRALMFAHCARLKSLPEQDSKKIGPQVDKIGLKPTSSQGFWEAESIPCKFYSPVRFFLESTQDDGYLGKERFYLKSQKLQPLPAIKK